MLEYSGSVMEVKVTEFLQNGLAQKWEHFEANPSGHNAFPSNAADALFYISHSELQ